MVRTAALPELLSRYRAELERALEAASARGLPLYRLVRYHLGFDEANGVSGNGSYLGKALRASLVLFAYEALTGEDWRPALPAAVAVELVHSFSLVHDDIQDRDEERHGRPTVWRLWGSGQAINVGDALRELAALSLHSLVENFPAEVVLRAARVLDEATLAMIEGQYLDLSYEERWDLTVEDYLEMVARKTGALLGAALELGALLARPDEPGMLQHFREVGCWLGLAFQARDDLLGIWGDPRRTGKSASSDLRNGKKSLPIVYALSSSGPEAAELRRLYSLPRLNEKELAQILGLLERCGAREWVQARAAEFCAQAAQLEGLLPGWARRLWRELLEFVVQRER